MIKRISQFMLALFGVVALGQIPITSLPPATLPLSGNEEIPMVQNNKTVQAPANKVGTPITSFSQITALWTPPCNAANLFLNGSGTCTNPSTPPQGPNTSVQYNNSGAFGGDATFTFVPGTGVNLQGTTANATTLVIDDTGQTNSGTNYAEWIKGANPNSNAGGLKITVGASGGDIPLWVANANNSDLFFTINASGGGELGNTNNGNGLVWTSVNNFHFYPALGIDTVIMDGSSGHFAAQVNGINAAGNSFGEHILAGTNTGDTALWIQNQTGGSNFADFFGDGSGFIGGSTSGPGMTWNSARNFEIQSTSGNAELNVHGHSNTFGLLIDSGAAAGHQDGLLIETGSTAGDQPIVIQTIGTGSPQEFLIFGDQHGYLGPDSTPHGGMSWNPTGNFTFFAPASGTGATVTSTSIAGGNSLALTQTGASGSLLTFGQTGAGANGSTTINFDNSGNLNIENFTAEVFIGTQNIQPVCLFTNTICKLTVNADGGITLNNGSTVTGGSQGAGTINTPPNGYFINGVSTGNTTTANSAAINTAETYVSAAYSIPANALYVGEMFHLRAYGTCTSTVANLVHWNLRIGPNGTTADTLLNGSLPVTSAAAGTNTPFQWDADISVRAIGASGSIFVESLLINQGGAATPNGCANGTTQIGPQNSGTTTIDTTVANKLGLSFVTAAATTTATFNQVWIQRSF